MPKSRSYLLVLTFIQVNRIEVLLYHITIMPYYKRFAGLGWKGASLKKEINIKCG